MVGNLLNVFRGSSSAIDPVCGMTVDTKNPNGGTHDHEGTTYYFCGTGCRLEFAEDPKGYLSGEKKMEM
ncbi:MAG TPA: YHS domain-containing protein [Dehalococcoidia bacterium]|nr:YHS domain-containing protein [Dehalococcoidia bacterium]